MSADDTRRVRDEVRAGAPKSAHTAVGIRLHAIMAEIATACVRPDHDAQDRLIDRSLRRKSWRTIDTLKAPATCELSTMVSRAVRHLPPIDWAVLAAETDRLSATDPNRRPDVVWRAPEPITLTTADGTRTGRVLIDDYKMGARVNTAIWRRNREQIEAYLSLGTERYGDDFLGVRVLLCSARSGSKLFIPGETDPVPLHDTPVNFMYTGALRSSYGAGHGRPEGCMCEPCREHRAAAAPLRRVPTLPARCPCPRPLRALHPVVLAADPQRVSLCHALAGAWQLRCPGPRPPPHGPGARGDCVSSISSDGFRQRPPTGERIGNNRGDHSHVHQPQALPG